MPARPDAMLDLDGTPTPRAPDRTAVPGPDPLSAALVQSDIRRKRAVDDYIRVSALLAKAQDGRAAEKRAAYRDGFAGGLLVGLGFGILVLLMWL